MHSIISNVCRRDCCIQILGHAILPIGYRIKIFCKREKLALDFGREGSATEKNIISEIWQLSPQVRGLFRLHDKFERAVQCFTEQQLKYKDRVEISTRKTEYLA